MGGVSTVLLVVIFVAGSGATWAAGVLLSKTTDSLDRRFGLGDEVGGLILLAIAGTLPEIAIVSSAALAGHLDLAVGNLIGGIAIQTLVLVALDASTGLKRPLSFLVGSLIPVLEALIVIVCLATVLGGAALPASTSLGGVSPTSIVVVVLWLGGLWVVNRTRKQPEWKVETPGSRPGRRSKQEDHPKERRPFVKRSTAYVATAFGLAAIVTLAAGVDAPVVGERPRRPDGPPGCCLRRDHPRPGDSAPGALERHRSRAARRPSARGGRHPRR